MPANVMVAPSSPIPSDTQFGPQLSFGDDCSMRASPAPVEYPAMEISNPHYEEGSNHHPNHDNRLLLMEDQKMVDIEQPHHHDVLCGRGVTTNRHAGNESFRSLVGLNKELYVSSTKRQKMQISRSIVEAVRSLDPPGRFLEKDPVNGLWSDIGHKKAVEKTSQALRDGAASLRKQLSADLGDPDFLNAVFDAEKNPNKQKDPNSEAKEGDTDENDSKSKPAVNSEDTMETDKVKTVVEKPKTPKKAKQVPVKKGHRRTKSNPCSGTASSKHHRRARPMETPPSPLARFAEKYPPMPPSPRSPGPLQSCSHPNSPVTWGGRISFHDNESPGSLGSIPSHSPYEPHQPSPKSYSAYGQPSSYRHYGRTHSFEYPGGPAPDGRSPYYQSMSWSYGSRYQHRYGYGERPPQGGGSSMKYSWLPPRHSQAPTPGESQPPPQPLSPPSSPLPRGPLPPGRHQFSPAGYRSNPGHEWSPRVLHHPAPPHEASPRVPHSPRPAGGTMLPSDAPQWRSPHVYRDHYGNASTPGAYPTSGESSASSGLSVPNLGGEGKYKHSPSPRVLLTPRSRASFGETPPRPPGHTSRDFAPPPPSLRFRSAPATVTSSGHRGETGYEYMTSSTGEEKKTEHEGDDSSTGEREPRPSLTKSSSPLAVNLSKSGDAEKKENLEGDENTRAEGVPSTVRRGSALSKRISKAAEGTEAPAHVEDIAMSPIPFDREDPSTLMELPENLLTLPISPCGPNDDPIARC